MNQRRVSAVVLSSALALGTLIAVGPQPQAQAATPLSSIVLKKSDLPAGLKVTENKADTAQTQAKGAHVSVSTLLAKGWVGTYTSTFEKSTSTTDLQIYSSVDSFKTVGGINWDLANGVSVIRKQLSNVKTSVLSGIGQQSLELTASGTTQKVKYAVLYVVFRHGTILGAAGVILAGKFSAPPSLSQVEHYASLMNGRIK